MNNLPGTFSLRNHFSSSPLFRPRSRSQAPPEVRYSFRRNHFSSCRPAEARSPRGSQGSRVRKRGPRPLFEGTTFPRSFPLRSVAQKREQIGSPGIIARFLREPLFLLPSGRDWRSGKQRHWADRRPRSFRCFCFFFSREPLSLIPLGSRMPRWPQSLSSNSFSSPSLQGGSGIPAVPKTGASVL
jgi:hypothetical protein